MAWIDPAFLPENQAAMNANYDFISKSSSAKANSVSDASSILGEARSLIDANTAKAQEMVEKQWKFNADEAQKNRVFQEYMSNTSLQRMVEDAKKAGINPIFLAGSGGASTPSGSSASGSSASPDTSGSSLLGSYLSSLISSATAINTANINAKTSLALGDINALSAARVAGINANSALDVLFEKNAFDEYIRQNYPNSVGDFVNLGATLSGGMDKSKSRLSEAGSKIVELFKGLNSKLEASKKGYYSSKSKPRSF